MRAAIWLAVLFVSISATVAQEKVAPGPAKNFLSLLPPGQRVLVTEDLAGYRITFATDQAAQATNSTAEMEARQADAARQVAVAEYQRAVLANRQAANAVPETEINRLKLLVHQRMLAAQVAQARAAAPVFWEVVVVGSDYIGLRNENSEMFVPLNSIRAIVRELKPLTSPPTGVKQ